MASQCQASQISRGQINEKDNLDDAVCRYVSCNANSTLASKFATSRSFPEPSNYVEMGQEQSFPIDESIPPQTLTDRSLASIANYIRNGQAQKIVVMVKCSFPVAGRRLTYVRGM